MEIEVLNASNSKSYGFCRVDPAIKIADLRSSIHQQINKTPDPNRQSIKLNSKGQSLKDTDTLQGLGLRTGDKIFIKDLGPQIGWKTVFLSEYAGPLIVYLIVYFRPSFVYSNDGPTSLATHLAAGCYTIHYVKRLVETVFVHRFSHSTMPMRNLFKNCAYYWGFTAYVAYHVNHPQFTPPCQIQVFLSLAAFFICEIGNLSIHLALRNLRPPGTKVRKIPVPDGNPFTYLFNFVSCPNYTYEIASWISFSVMTSCLPAMLFALAGAYQMTVWAIGKHRNYKKEFKDYPKTRKAIFPFLL